MVSEAKDQVDLTRCQRQLLGVTDDLTDCSNGHPALFINFTATEEVLTNLLNVDVHDAAAGQIVTHLVQVIGKVAIFNLIVAKLHDIVAEEQVDLLNVEVAGVVENLAHLIEGDHASVLLCLSVGVKSLEPPLQDERDLLNLSFEDKLQSLFVDLLSLSGLLSEHLVARKEGLDSVDTDRDKVGPGDVANVVLISEGEEHTDVVLAKVISRKQLKGLIELHVGELTAASHISLRKEESESALERLDKAGRLDVNLLRLVQLLVEVLCLHDIELGNEGVNWLTLLIDITGVFELSSKMQKLLNLVLVLKNTVNPAL